MSTHVSNSSRPFVGNDINDGARYLFIVVGMTEVVCGIGGNSILLAAMLRKQTLKLRNVHNLFIANLALADLLSVGYWLPFMVLDLLLGFYPVVNSAHCVVNGFIVCTCLAVSVFSLSSISLNRYIHVCHSQRFSKTVTLQRTVVCCILIWIFACILATPPLLGVGRYYYSSETHICSFEKDMYANITTLCFSVLPMCLVGYWNFAIFRFWKNSRMPASTRESPRRGEDTRTDRKSMESKILQWSSKTEVMYSDGRETEPQQIANSERSFINGFGQNDPLLPPIPVSVPAKDFSDEHDNSLGDLNSDVSDHNTKSRMECIGRQISFSETVKGSPLQPVKRLNSSVSFGQESIHMQQLQERVQNRKAKERALVRSLFVVFILTVAAFFPFFIINTVHATEGALPSELHVLGNLLLFLNNSVNWIVYGAMNRSFRHEYRKCLRRMCLVCFKLFHFQNAKSESLKWDKSTSSKNVDSLAMDTSTSTE